MKMRILIAAAAVVTCGAAVADEHHVDGYYKKDGTYVEPHEQTNPNGNRDDNWSTRGNQNPYTGERGTKPRDEDKDE